MVKILSVNDTNSIPGAVICVDVAYTSRPDEIAPGVMINQFLCGAAVAARMENGKWTREKSLSFSTTVEFWNWLNFVRRAGQPTWLFGLSMSRTLTLLGLWDRFDCGDILLNLPPHPSAHKARSHKARYQMNRVRKGLLITGGPPVVAMVYHQSRWKLTCLDLANFLEKSATELAALMQMELNGEPSTCQTLSGGLEACVARTAIIAEAVKRLIVWHNQQELGKFGFTVSGIAMAAFRHRFMRDRIELPEDQDDRDWERAGYFNGRVEALWCGKIKGNVFTPLDGTRKSGELFEDRPVGPFHVVDSRSFYGAIDCFEEMPIACTESHCDGNYGPPPIDESLAEVMAVVWLESESDSYPVKTARGSFFARGRFQTQLCGPELLRAVRAGHVKGWGSWKRYKLSQPLRWLADGFWKERIKHDAAGDQLTAALCKSIIARIHGKFLQRKTRWVSMPHLVALEPWKHWKDVYLGTGRVEHFRSIGEHVQMEDDAGDGPFCFPALAAWVTACGREWLRKWMNIAGPRRVLYLATDSLIVDQVGLDNLTKAGIIWPEGIGSCRVLRSSPDIEIRGPNNYTHAGRTVIAGAGLADLELSGSCWKSKRWAGLDETFASESRDQVISYAVHGSTRGLTCPGTVGPGGWITPPRLSTPQVRKWEKIESE